MNRSILFLVSILSIFFADAANARQIVQTLVKNKELPLIISAIDLDSTRDSPDGYKEVNLYRLVATQEQGSAFYTYKLAVRCKFSRSELATLSTETFDFQYRSKGIKDEAVQFFAPPAGSEMWNITQYVCQKFPPPKENIIGDVSPFAWMKKFVGAPEPVRGQ